MTINIFGAGFIGSRYAEMYPEEVEVIERDSLDADTEAIFGKILYFISTTHNYHVKTNPFLDIETNLLHLMQVLEFNLPKEFNFISSWFVYGKLNDLPAKETSPCFPTGFYSATKFCAENLLQSYCQTYDINYRILRLPNVLGVGDKKASPKKNALQWMTKCIVQGIPVSSYKGNDEVIRDYMHVDDVCRAIHLVINSDKTLNSITNIGNGIPCIMQDLINYVVRKTGGKVGTMEVPKFHGIVQTKKMWMDNSKLLALGFKPQYTVYDALDELIEFYGKTANS